MEFHQLRNGRSIQRPSPEMDDLTAEVAAFKGEFDLDEVYVDGGDQEGVRGEGSIAHSLIERVNFSRAQFSPLAVSDTLFREVDFSNAIITGVTLRSLELRGCQAIGLRLSYEQVADLYAEGTRFDFAVINLGRVKGIAGFKGCSFKESTLIGDLSNVVFDDCDFARAEFRVTNAAGCTLTTSRIEGAQGLLTLRGAVITANQAASIAEQLATEAGLTVEN